MKPASSRDQAPPGVPTSPGEPAEAVPVTPRAPAVGPAPSREDSSRGGKATKRRPETDELIDFSTLASIASTMERIAKLAATGAMPPAASRAIIMAAKTAQAACELDQSEAITRLEKLIEQRQPATIGRRSR